MSKNKRYLRLIRSIAYDPLLFERCIALIAKIIELEKSASERDEGKRILASLFTIYLSGTHATIEKRLSVIKSLIQSEDQTRLDLGLAGLKATLETSHFGPGWDFEFGAHSRDYGWWPRNRQEVKYWFSTTLSLVEEVVRSPSPISLEVSDIAAGKFRGLWTGAGMYGELERIFRAIRETGFWPRGWIAVRETSAHCSLLMCRGRRPSFRSTAPRSL